MEEWRDIKGYEELYQISNKGNVMRLTFRNGTVTKNKRAAMHPFDNGSGYLLISLRKGKCRKNHYVHRLVAEAFIPEKRDKSKLVVNHKDHDRANNDVENLEWCTQKENVAASVHLMRKPRTHSKPTNTGEKYINRRRNGRYRVELPHIPEKSFLTFEQALAYKQSVTLEVRNDTK